MSLLKTSLLSVLFGDKTLAVWATLHLLPRLRIELRSPYVKGVLPLDYQGYLQNLEVFSLDFWQTQV